MMAVLRLEGGNPVMWDEMWDHGRCGTGRGWSSPEGGFREALETAQTGQAETNSLMSRVCHQNLCCTTNRVRAVPGWQKSWEECSGLENGGDLVHTNGPVGRLMGAGGMGVYYCSFDVKAGGSQTSKSWQDKACGVCNVHRVERSGEGVSFDVLGTGMVG